MSSRCFYTIAEHENYPTFCQDSMSFPFGHEELATAARNSPVAGFKSEVENSKSNGEMLNNVDTKTLTQSLFYTGNISPGL